jgi:hypothetical protein
MSDAGLRPLSPTARGFIAQLPGLPHAVWNQTREQAPAANPGVAASLRGLVLFVVKGWRTYRSHRVATNEAGEWLARGVHNGVLPKDPRLQAAVGAALGALIAVEGSEAGIVPSGYAPFQPFLPLARLAASALAPEDLDKLYGPAIPRVAAR